MVSAYRWRRASAATAAMLILAPVLSSCATLGALQESVNSGGSKIESPAEMQNSGFAKETNTLLDQMWQGDWELPVGGNVRVPCKADEAGEAYEFYGSWFSPAEAAYSADRVEAMHTISAVREWLEADGWEYLENFEFTTDVVDVNAVGVGGSKRDAGVSDMQVVYYFEGQVERPYPHIVVDVDSTCLLVDI